MIEVLVALTLFTIVVTMAVGTLLVLIDANVKSQNSQAIMTNLAFTLDSMTRDIRTGFDYECNDSPTGSTLQLTTGSTVTRDCVSGPVGSNNSNSFAFTETGGSLTGVAGGRIGFRLNNGAIERNISGNNTSQYWQPITATNIKINQLRFVTTGTDRTDNVPPTVTIYISGTAGTQMNASSTFNLQTTITQVPLDI